MTLRQRLLAQSLLAVAITVVVGLAIGAWRGAGSALVAAAVAAAVSGLVAALGARKYARAARDLEESTRALASGDRDARPALDPPGELGGIAAAVNRLREQLDTRFEALNAEDALLKALVASLNEGVIAIDAQHRLVHVNDSGRELLGIDREAKSLGLDRLPRDPVVHQAVHAALRGVSTGPTEAQLGGRRVSLTARPLAGGGAVIALYDLTELRRLEQVRRDFVANVSHELRTPLTVISGFAETLADDDVPADHRRQFADLIRTHTTRMQRIVDDLLDLSRMESGGWVPSAEEVDLAAAARDAIALVAETAAAKGLELRTDVPATAARITVDRTALRQILSNLLENAVRHTTSGSITVFADAEDGGVWIGVRDTGSGIPIEHLPRIFERFYRVDAGRARGRGGTGLGLAIVKHLAEAHGGGVRADSELGRGTSIAVFLPHRQEAQLPLQVG